ncbi:50S ribosomal protein L19 [Candidatus Peregrinibacteria bacterium]|nr:MAG: 50S ribosomal protein L19 [Candidatus Peregrinibacteria bacterium]
MHPLIQEVQKSQFKRIPEVRAGYTVSVHQKIKEAGKERVQIFEGLVIRVASGSGLSKTFTVRKVVEGIGVEKVFPFHSANIVKIDIRKKAKVRRAKLYYMRDRFGKSARLKEKQVTDQERADEEAKMDALIAEAVEAEAAKKAEETAMDQAEESAEAPVVEEVPQEESAEEMKEESNS